MAVSDGNKVNAAVTNAAFISRTTDSNTTGKIDFDNADAASGASVTNVQQNVNGVHSFSGSTPNGAKDQKPSWVSDVIGVANENIKSRVDAVQAQVEQNDTDIDTKVDKITSTDNAVTRYDGVGGDVQDSGVLIDDSNNITGVNDLTINGTLSAATLNTISSTVTEVADANITVNNGGTQATADAQDAGFTVEMSDATDAQIGYDSTLTSKFKAGEVGSEAEIATVSAAQILTNKTIDGNNNTISNLAHGAEVDDPSSGVHGVTGNVVGTTDAQTLTNKTTSNLLNNGYIEKDEIATPATPGTGKNRLYFKTDAKLYRLDDVGTEVEVGGGAVDSVNSQTGVVVLDIDDVTPTTTKGDIIVENGTNAVRLPVGTDGQVLKADSAEATGVKWDTNTALATFTMAVIRDEKSSGTAGDSIGTGSYGTVTLNTIEEQDTGGDISLSANVITLANGTYAFDFLLPAVQNSGAPTGQNYKAKLRNTSDAVDEIIGQSTGAGIENNGRPNGAACRVQGIITVAGGPKNYELQDRAAVAGLLRGKAVSFGDSEVYTAGSIIKIG